MAVDLVLHYAPNTRAGRVRWLLEELGAPYRLRRLELGAKPDDFLAISPLGKVPVLEIDGRPMIESAAMLIWLADRFADRGLAPAPDAPDRAAYLQWQVFVVATLEPPLLALFKAPDDAARDAAAGKTRAALAVLEAAVADGREFVLGAAMSAADCAIGQVTGWARGAGLLATFPALTAYGRRLSKRDAYRRARDA
jgi:glutathione S-transferase